MELHAQVELFGGPEDGREFTLPVGVDGAPLSPLPVPAQGSERDSEAQREIAWYERYQRRGRDAWVYKYVNSNSVQEPAAAHENGSGARDVGLPGWIDA